MARRWQLSLWVLAGLAVTVAALWESATTPSVAARFSERTEAGGELVGPDTQADARSNPALGEVAGSDLDRSGDANVLRPTTTTTTRPTTTTSTTEPTADTTADTTAYPDDGDGESGDDPRQEPGQATTSASRPGTSSTTVRRSSTTVPGDPALTTVYYEDFADGSLAAGRWEVATSSGAEGWGLLRPSSVVVEPDPASAGGHLLAVVARMGTGEEAGHLVSGGVRLLGQSLTEGRYSVRARIDPDSSEATSGLILLRPEGGGVPAADGDEIRIMETSRNRATRTPVESTARWVDGATTRSVTRAHSHSSGPVSAAAWHVYTVDRTAGRVTVSIDGVEPLSLMDDSSAPEPGPMDLVVRVDAVSPPSGPGRPPTLTGEIRLLIDWIRIERKSDRSGIETRLRPDQARFPPPVEPG